MHRTPTADRRLHGTGHDGIDGDDVPVQSFGPFHARRDAPGLDAFGPQHGCGGVHVSDNEDLMRLHALLSASRGADALAD
jgi:hypothetical protein